MKAFVAVIAVVLAACAAPISTAAPKARALPSAAPTQQQRMNADLVRQTTEQDLLWSALKLFGEPLVRRALAADAYIFAKHYPGMLPPPPPDAGPDWKYPEPTTAVLWVEDGSWLAASPQGIRQARADKIQELRQILSSELFWAEPVWAPPRCTDAGASLLLAKIPGRREVVRSATCGGTGQSELLVFRSLES